MLQNVSTARGVMKVECKVKIKFCSTIQRSMQKNGKVSRLEGVKKSAQPAVDEISHRYERQVEGSGNRHEYDCINSFDSIRCICDLCLTRGIIYFSIMSRFFSYYYSNVLT